MGRGCQAKGLQEVPHSGTPLSNHSARHPLTTARLHHPTTARLRHLSTTPMHFPSTLHPLHLGRSDPRHHSTPHSHRSISQIFPPIRSTFRLRLSAPHPKYATAMAMRTCFPRHNPELRHPHLTTTHPRRSSTHPRLRL